ncbi:MAG: acyl-protein synthetase [Alteromonadaceae bacterium TMED7]|nr:acyl-protein synthetase [Alteromonadaceae bacterium]RPH17055.1 MAG: acyl-protein synthetase [Alteromonadaceae bacterium TMED7]
MYNIAQADKEALLLPLFKLLHDWHLTRSVHYHRLFGHTESPEEALAELPYLAVRLFKQLALKSISEDQLFRVLQSSGTTAQVPARVFLDKDTSARQSKALVRIMQHFIGKQRLPMLIIDSPAVMDKSEFSARAAGIQGMAFFGRKPVYALNNDMSLNEEAICAFAKQHNNTPVLLFGFTFMVWLHFVKALQRRNLKIALPKGVLVHSGGWKKLSEQQVDNSTFKQTLKSLCGLSHIYNFYGMAEQVGSVFVECEAGHLHAPLLADIVIRDPISLAPLPIGKVGLIQVLSVIPTSYPGHSILTEDKGQVLGVDDCSCGRKGQYFAVLGRLPKTEIRGCSDTGDKA